MSDFQHLRARRTAAVLSALALACLGVACSESAETLSQAEIRALAAQIATLDYEHLAIGLPGGSPSPGPAAATGARLTHGTVRPGAGPSGRARSPHAVPAGERTISADLGDGWECPAGGVVSVGGTVVATYDDVVDSLSATLELGEAHIGCAFPVGDTFVTISGAPELDLDATVVRISGEPVGDQTLTYAGTIDWSRRDRTGRCEVDVAAKLSPAPDGTAHIAGVFCGKTLDHTTGWVYDP